MKKDTLLTQIGRDPARYNGMVNTPVFRTSTVIHPNLASYEKRPPDGEKIVRYGRYGTPTTFALEEAVARMEGGFRAAAVPSGLAAIASALSAFLKAGDHLLVSDSAYAPTRTFCEKQLRRNGVDVQYYDPLIGAGIAALIKDATRAVFCEAPGSLTFEMQDIPAIAAAAHARGAAVIHDNAWATGVFYRSFEHGADIVVQPCTKYPAGHSDVIIGAVIANEAFWPAVRDASRDYGQMASPDDIFLALRGMRTLEVRLRQHEKSGLHVARWLERHPAVERVLHPGLEGDPGHALWKRDYLGCTGLFGVALKPCSDAALAAFLDSLELFALGYSWGGFESLVVPQNIHKSRSVRPWTGGPLIRLHVGLEDPDDLCADLAQGLERIRSA